MASRSRKRRRQARQTVKTISLTTRAPVSVPKTLSASRMLKKPAGLHYKPRQRRPRLHLVKLKVDVKKRDPDGAVQVGRSGVRVVKGPVLAVPTTKKVYSHAKPWKKGRRPVYGGELHRKRKQEIKIGGKK